jgi:hypothetical protein
MPISVSVSTFENKNFPYFLNIRKQKNYVVYKDRKLKKLLKYLMCFKKKM